MVYQKFICNICIMEVRHMHIQPKEMGGEGRAPHGYRQKKPIPKRGVAKACLAY